MTHHSASNYPVQRFRFSPWHGERLAICRRMMVLGICAGLSSCGQNIESKAPIATAGFSGTVTGAQQPITGAHIQLYAVGSTGNGSAATPLISVALTTSDGTAAINSNANPGNKNNLLPAGSFTIADNYTCPSETTPVYLLATGGNPGLTQATTNPQIALMAALGPCGAVQSATVVIDELTTIGSIAPLLSFMDSAGSLGSAPGDVSQLLAAIAEVSLYTNVASGTVPGPSLPSGYYASTQVIETLADILALCIHSSGGAAGDPTPCGQLFMLANPRGSTAPRDTTEAVLDILRNPTANAASIYGLLPAVVPFAPALPVAPASWNLPILPVPTTFSPALNRTSIFIGASIINGWPLPLNNAGIPGQTSSQVLARFSSTVLNHSYKRVIILCGTNDVLLGTPNLVANLTANLAAMARIASQAGIEVVLSQLPPLTGNSASFDPQISAVNAAIAQLAHQNGYLVVDYNSALRGHPEDFSDGVHPTAAGYSIMERALASAVVY